MSFTDLAGTWQYLGTITPLFEQWQEFPIPTNSSNSLIRATYYGEFNKILSRGYLRAVYRLPDVIKDQNWIRLYPKPEREMIPSKIPQEILYVQSVSRTFEVMKKPRRRSYYQTQYDNWSIALESLEYVNLTDQQAALLDKANQIEAAAEIIKSLLGN